MHTFLSETFPGWSFILVFELRLHGWVWKYHESYFWFTTGLAMVAEYTHNVLTANHNENDAIDTALDILSVYKEDA